MKIEDNSKAFVHGAMILPIQFGAYDVWIALPQSASDNLFAPPVDSANRCIVDLKITPLSVEENVNIGNAGKD